MIPRRPCHVCAPVRWRDGVNVVFARIQHSSVDGESAYLCRDQVLHQPIVSETVLTPWLSCRTVCEQLRGILRRAASWGSRHLLPYSSHSITPLFLRQPAGRQPFRPLYTSWPH